MMTEAHLDQRFDKSIRNRVRETCITHCANYLVLREVAETEQAKINAARAAGKRISGSPYVKLICPYDPNVECPGFVHAATIEDGSADIDPDAKGGD